MSKFPKPKMEFEKNKAKRQKTLDLNVAQGGGGGGILSQSQAMEMPSTSKSSRLLFQALPLTCTSSSTRHTKKMEPGLEEVKFKPNDTKWTPKKLRSQTREEMGSGWDDFKLKPELPRIEKLKQDNSLRMSLLRKVAATSALSYHAKVKEMEPGWDDFKFKPNDTKWTPNKMRSQTLQEASTSSSSHHAKVEEMELGWDDFKRKPNDTKYTPKIMKSQALEEMGSGWDDFKYKPNDTKWTPKIGPVWFDYKFKPYETMSTAAEMQHPTIQKLKEENALQMSLLPQPPKTYKTLASSMLMKPLAIDEWPKPKAYNGKSLIYYGSVDSSDEDEDEDEDADVDVVGLSDVDLDEDSDLSDFGDMDMIEGMGRDIQDFVQKIIGQPVERFRMGNLPPMEHFRMGNLPPMAPIVHHPLEDFYDDDDDEDDDDDWDETNDEGYEDMTTEEEDDWEEEIEEKPLVPYPNCLGPCALIERIVGSDIDRTDALDRIVAHL